MKILHAISENDLKHLEDGSYHPDSLDKDGFIHFSCFNQISRVANSIYAGRSDMKLAVVELIGETARKVVFEDLYDMDEKFPHLYSGLKPEWVDSVEELKFENGRFKVNESTVIKCTEKNYALENGKTLKIRHSVESDAADIVKYVQTVIGESDNLSMGEGEFEKNDETERDYIEALCCSKGNYNFCGFVDGKLVSNLSVNRPSRRRLSHRASIGISVLKEYWGKGIGSVMMDHMIEFLKTRGNTKKICLQVREDNQAAIHVYEKKGFVTEGKDTMSMIINEKPVNLFYMGLIL